MKPLNYCYKSLIFIGLNPDLHETTNYYKYVKWAYLVVLFGNSVPQTTFLVTYIQDVAKVTQALPVYLENIFMMLKLISYSVGIVQLHQILRTLKKYSDNRVRKDNFKNQLEAERKSRFLCRFYGALVLSTIILLAIVPAVIQFATFLMGAATDATFKEPFNNVYFFDNNRRYVYQAFYAISSIATACISYSLFALDCLFCMIILYISAAIDDLQDYIREIDDTFNEDGNSPVLYRHVKTVVDFHSFLLSFVQRFEKSAGSIFALQYVGSTGIICCVIFQFIAIDNDLSALSQMFSYLTAGMCQLLMYCWHGNMITEKCLEISGTIYSLQWYNYPNDIKKSILMVIIRSQKPVVVKGWGLLRGNLEGFMSVLNTSMSALAVLRSIN